MNWTEGTSVRSVVTFSDLTGMVAADPTTITFKYADPDGNTTTILYPAAGITRDTTGVYHADVLLNQNGKWNYRWLGTGVVAVAYDGVLSVPYSVLA